MSGGWWTKPSADYVTDRCQCTLRLKRQGAEDGMAEARRSAERRTVAAAESDAQRRADMSSDVLLCVEALDCRAPVLPSSAHTVLLLLPVWR